MTADDNIVISCRRCNYAKGRMTTGEFLWLKASMIPVGDIAAMVGARKEAVVAACELTRTRVVRSHGDWLVHPDDVEGIKQIFEDAWR